MDLPRQLAVTRHRFVEDGHLTWHRHGERPSPTQFRHRVAVAHEHVRRRSGRRGLASVKRHDFARRQADKHEASATDAGVMAVDYAEHESRDDCGVDRVTTLAHDLDTGLAGQVMHRGDHTTTRFFRCLTYGGQQHEHEQGQSLHSPTLLNPAPPAIRR